MRTPAPPASTAREAFQAQPAKEEGYQAARAMLMASGGTPKQLEDIAMGHAAALQLSGDTDGALAACDAALADPPAPDWGQRVSLLRARLLRRKGDFSEALKAYESMHAKWPDNKPAALELGALELQFGRTADAQAVYEDLAQRGP